MEIKNNIFKGGQRLKLSVLFVVLLGFVHIGFGQTWTGNVNTDWNTSGNWDGGVVPSSGSSVIINGALSNYPVIPTGLNVAVSSVQLGNWQSSAQLIINGSLTVSGNFSIPNDTDNKLYLDGGSLTVDGTFSTAYSSDTMFVVNSNGSFTCNSYVEVNCFIKVNDGNLSYNNGLKVNYSKSITMLDGTLNTLGDVRVYGYIYGGESQITFDGDPGSDDLVIRSGGRFYMDMVDGTCPTSLVKPPPTTNGRIEFKIPATVENNGQLHIGDAIVTFYHDIQTQGSAIVTIWNGQLIFAGDGVFGNSSTLSVDCKGSIIINGDGTFSQSGNIDIGNGDLTIGGTATFSNSGTLDAEDGDISFVGDVTIANSGGTINAGNSEITFEGGTFDNSGTFNADSSTFIFAGDGEQNIEGDDIEFFDVVIEDGADVVTTVDVVIHNDLDIEDGATLGTDPDADIETIDVIGDLNGGGTVTFERPFISSIIINSLTSITLVFNEEVTAATAEIEGNYAITNNGGASNPSITSATRDAVNVNKVDLDLSIPIVEGVVYRLTVNNVADPDGHTVSPNHKKDFKLEEVVNALVRNITESSDSTAAVPIYSATTCPDLIPPHFNPDNDGPYDPGVSYVDFRVDLETSTDEWQFDYSISGGTATLVRVGGDQVTPTTQGTTPMVTAFDNDFVYFRFKIVNVPGSEQSITFSISNVTDTENSVNETNTSDNSVTHILSMMPPVGPFGN